MPRSSISPEVGSGTGEATDDHEALAMAPLRFNVVLPVFLSVVETASVVSVCVPAAVV